MTKKKTATNRKKQRSLQTTADSDLLKLRLRLSKKQEYIAVLELELYNTRAVAQEFSLLYNERILPLERYLRSLRNALFKALEAKRQQENGKNGNGHGPGVGPQFEQPPEADAPEFEYEDQDSANGWRKTTPQAKAPNPQTEEKIRALFRELAKRFHPDLTSDPDEKAWRKEVMTKVNQAYAQRDLKALQDLAEQPDRPVKSDTQTRHEEIEFLKAELVRLDGVINDLKASIRHLEESPAWRLMMEARLQRKTGHDLLTEMETEIKEQIDDLEEHLTVLGVSVQELTPEPEATEAEAEPAD